MTDKKTGFYMGKRLVGKMPRHTMQNDEGGWHYPKAKDVSFYGAVIGREYTMPEKGLPRPWHDAETGNVHPCAEEWQVEHRDALELKKASTKEPAPEVMEHVEALAEACRKMTSAQRTRFLTYLIERFTKWYR